MSANIRRLARYLAQDAVSDIEYQAAMETAEHEGIPLTGDEVAEAVRLSRRAKVVIPDD